MKNTVNVSPEIIHIPEKPSFLPHLQPTVNMLAAVIEPKDANTLVRKLNHIAPLENLQHVKRVQKKCIDGGKPQLSLLLSVAAETDVVVLELVKSYQLSTFITRVCKYAATSKEEWEEQCKLWPTSYHPPTYNISGITGFSEEDSQSIFGFMRHTIDLATSSVVGQVVNAAVIVDPSTKQVIASACDQVISSASLANEVSKERSCSNYLKNLNQQRLLLDRSIGEFKHIINNVACVHPWRWALQSSGCWHPLRHAAIVAIEYSAARDRQLFPDYKALCHLESDIQTNGHSSESLRPYLCTGCDIYLAWEPCAMCAMALVHQRVRRIFFSSANSNAGALGSVHRLQGERSLNHHYGVFRVLLPEVVKLVDSKTAGSG
ncbi:tRNA-specific adenosine deaminase TAD3-like [Lycium barbarum]|uniref:tRNA-specific adenosine deaminase TAD3-like n=1 Tax=Lycium barbarum TaxID=112863 RepID=UPI00293EED5F|nr:tRNA-specific adenosine deaminase TAD3-like [Lycium barbarum]XP_060203554.1 tRNA-specific adenosine deaminase TAD3-like [Lycium barbarum]XP_060203555.1 tRNA-specific adenosine deaminase TAD3-like [Lycium barbarum]XP_060203556.1 tRNA-specific adenosine deaminase TAD3-like [Lycium barbarum]